MTQVNVPAVNPNDPAHEFTVPLLIVSVPVTDRSEFNVIVDEANTVILLKLIPAVFSVHEPVINTVEFVAVTVPDI